MLCDCKDTEKVYVKASELLRSMHFVKFCGSKHLMDVRQN